MKIYTDGFFRLIEHGFLLIKEPFIPYLLLRSFTITYRRYAHKERR